MPTHRALQQHIQASATSSLVIATYGQHTVSQIISRSRRKLTIVVLSTITALEFLHKIWNSCCLLTTVSSTSQLNFANGETNCQLWKKGPKNVPHTCYGCSAWASASTRGTLASTRSATNNGQAKIPTGIVQLAKDAIPSIHLGIAVFADRAVTKVWTGLVIVVEAGHRRRSRGKGRSMGFGGPWNWRKIAGWLVQVVSPLMGWVIMTSTSFRV
jgi:hypothetical protein